MCTNLNNIFKTFKIFKLIKKNELREGTKDRSFDCVELKVLLSKTLYSTETQKLSDSGGHVLNTEAHVVLSLTFQSKAIHFPDAGRVSTSTQRP